MLSGVTNQLYDTFGSSYTYYLEDVKQNMTKPCFTVDCVLPLQRSRNRYQYDRTIPIVVHYFSGDKETPKKDCYEKAELTVEALEYVPFGGALIRGEDISWKMLEDDILQVFITYKFITNKVTSNEDKMENVDQSTRTII